MTNNNPFAVAITGASGAPYAVRLLQELIRRGERVDVMISAPGQIVLGMETSLNLPGRSAEIQRALSAHCGAAEGQLRVFGRQEWTAPLASGSRAPRAMVVCPCTTGTLALSIASLAEALSPICLITAGLGPMNLIPQDSQASAKSGSFFVSPSW